MIRLSFSMITRDSHPEPPLRGDDRRSELQVEEVQSRDEDMLITSCVAPVTHSFHLSTFRVWSSPWSSLHVLRSFTNPFGYARPLRYTRLLLSLHCHIINLCSSRTTHLSSVRRNGGHFVTTTDEVREGNGNEWRKVGLMSLSTSTPFRRT